MSTRGAADATPTQDVVELREQRAALRRLTALVAQRATLDELFGAVVTEVAHVLDAPKAWLLRNEPDGSITVLASRGDPTFPPGSRWASEGAPAAAQMPEVCIAGPERAAARGAVDEARRP